MLLIFSFGPRNYLTSVKNINWIVAWVASIPEIAFFDFELKPRIMSDLSLFIQIGVEFFGESFVENFRSKFCLSTKNDEGEDFGLCLLSLPLLSIWSKKFGWNLKHKIRFKVFNDWALTGHPQLHIHYYFLLSSTQWFRTTASGITNAPPRRSWSASWKKK